MKLSFIKLTFIGLEEVEIYEKEYNLRLRFLILFLFQENSSQQALLSCGCCHIDLRPRINNHAFARIIWEEKNIFQKIFEL